MTKIEEINSLIKNCLQIKESYLDERHEKAINEINVLKSIKTKATALAKEQKVEITDSIIEQAARKEVKELKQTISMSPKDSPLYNKTVTQLKMAEKFLPIELPEETMARYIKAVIMAMPQGSTFGMKMKVCKEKLSDKIEVSKIAELIKKYNF